MRISFTGPRTGISVKQIQDLEAILLKLQPNGASHGMCTGADVQFHNVCRRLFGQKIYIVGYPSTHESRTMEYLDCNLIGAAKAPLARTADILNFGRDSLIAAPAQIFEVLRSGTWSTVRAARKRNMQILFAWPE